MNAARPTIVRLRRRGPDKDVHGRKHLEPGGAAGVARARRHRPAVRALLDGPDGSEPGRAAPERGPQAHGCAAPLDRGHLRVPGRGLAHHHGHAGRSDRPKTAPDDRCRRVRRRLRDRRVLEQRRDADRNACAAGARGRDAGPLDTLPDPQHVPRSRAAHVRHRGMGHQLLGRRRHRPAPRRHRAAAFLVGRGVPHRRARDAAHPRARTDAPAGVPGSQCRPAGLPERGAFPGGRPRSWSASPSASRSCGGSSRSPIR
jgi:hypothetical protein